MSDWRSHGHACSQLSAAAPTSCSPLTSSSSIDRYRLACVHHWRTQDFILDTPFGRPTPIPGLCTSVAHGVNASVYSRQGIPRRGARPPNVSDARLSPKPSFLRILYCGLLFRRATNPNPNPNHTNPKANSITFGIVDLRNKWVSTVYLTFEREPVQVSKYLTKGRIAAAHGRFIGIRQVTPMCTPI